MSGSGCPSTGVGEGLGLGDGEAAEGDADADDFAVDEGLADADGVGLLEAVVVLAPGVGDGAGVTCVEQA